MDLEITCLPANLPVSIDVDLANLDAGETITLSAIELPEGVEYAGASTDPDPALATALAVGGGAEEESEDGEDGGEGEAAEEPSAE